MPARIYREFSDAYTRSSHVYDDDRGLAYSDRLDPYSTPRRGPAYDYYPPSYKQDKRHHSRERDRYISVDDLSRQHRSISDRDSYGRAGSSRTPERSDSSRHSRHHRTHVIDTSRPPVSSRSQRDQPESVRVSRSSRRDSVSSRKSRTISSPRPFSRWFGGGSSTRPSSPEKPPKRERRSRSENPGRPVSCVACLESTSPSRSTSLACGHQMCNSCIRRLFTMSVTDPAQHMPPRCCTQEHIPLRKVDELFDSDFKKDWNRKFSEYTTRNRLYCPSRKCGQWIKPENIRRENGRKVARCSRCRIKVCGSCGGRHHSSAECHKDEDTVKLLSQAADQGWKRCYRCKAMIELKEGCNHMTCRCGAEFCMTCGVKWKRCNCSWFNNNPAGAHHLGMNVHGYHPQTQSEEMRLRRLQELRDKVVATNMQADADYDMMGGIGTINGIGNAAGHFMNESYRRDDGSFSSRARPLFDLAAGYVSDVNRARRNGPGLVERASSTRSRNGRQLSPVAPPLRYAHGDMPLRRDAHVRHGRVDEGDYPGELQRSRSERVMPARTSRRYEDEAAIHTSYGPYGPYSGRRASFVPPRGSAMAGLNGKDRGMGRVAEWRGYVEPGVPDGESVVGHA